MKFWLFRMFINSFTYKYKRGEPIYYSSGLYVKYKRLNFRTQYLFMIYVNYIFYLLNNNFRRILSE